MPTADHDPSTTAFTDDDWLVDHLVDLVQSGAAPELARTMALQPWWPPSTITHVLKAVFHLIPGPKKTALLQVVLPYGEPTATETKDNRFSLQELFKENTDPTLHQWAIDEFIPALHARTPLDQEVMAYLWLGLVDHPTHAMALADMPLATAGRWLSAHQSSCPERAHQPTPEACVRFGGDEDWWDHESTTFARTIIDVLRESHTTRPDRNEALLTIVAGHPDVFTRCAQLLAAGYASAIRHPHLLFDPAAPERQRLRTEILCAVLGLLPVPQATAIATWTAQHTDQLPAIMKSLLTAAAITQALPEQSQASRALRM